MARQQVDLVFDFETSPLVNLRSAAEGWADLQRASYRMRCQWQPAPAITAKQRLDHILPIDRARTRYGRTPWVFTGRLTEPEYVRHETKFNYDGADEMMHAFVPVSGNKPIYGQCDVEDQRFLTYFSVARCYNDIAPALLKVAS